MVEICVDAFTVRTVHWWSCNDIATQGSVVACVRGHTVFFVRFCDSGRMDSLERVPLQSSSYHGVPMLGSTAPVIAGHVGERPGAFRFVLNVEAPVLPFD